MSDSMAYRNAAVTMLLAAGVLVSGAFACTADCTRLKQSLAASKQANKALERANQQHDARKSSARYDVELCHALRESRSALVDVMTDVDEACWQKREMVLEFSGDLVEMFNLLAKQEELWCPPGE
jgi:hypothetical protein